MNFSSLQDEYDDFGRKKKKKNKGPGAVSGGRDSGSNGWGGTKKKVKDAEVLHRDKEIKRPREIFSKEQQISSDFCNRNPKYRMAHLLRERNMLTSNLKLRLACKLIL